MKRGAPYFDLWALATKSDLNEEELLQLAQNHFIPILIMTTLNIDKKDYELVTLSDECKAQLFHSVSTSVKISKRMVGHQEIWS